MKYENLAESTKKLYNNALAKLEGDKLDFENVMRQSENLSVHQKKVLYKALIHIDENNKKKYFDIINGYSREERKKKEEGNLRLYSKAELEMLDAFERVMKENDKRRPYVEIYNRLENGTMEKALLMLNLLSFESSRSLI